MRTRTCLVISLFALTAVTAAPPAGNWPSFRGENAAGVADGVNLPETWDGVEGANIKWKTPIPGLAHSSPVVWGDTVFVTSAVSSRGEAKFRPGLYGDGDAAEDRSPHKWNVYALDRKTGKILWERTAFEGPPREKRHIKSTYASSTPATDGKIVVALFGSQGIYAFDFKGKLLWQHDLGRLNVGAYNDPTYEWGTASSPIIYKGKVIVQCDTSEEDFLIALDLRTGKTVWRTARDEKPSWGTPTVYNASARHELVTNAPHFIRGYDPETGKELWKLGGSSNITAPTPVFTKDLIVVASGRRPVAPIFVLRPGASGDITLPQDQHSSDHVAWHRTQRGPYMPTPLIYQGYLYILNNAGIFDCYELASGREVYRDRIPHGGSGFSASPVAADGRIYLPSEDGDIFVVRAGEKFELLGKNRIGELLMATPALTQGMMIVRAEKHVYAISR